MQKIFQHIRKQPKSVRENYAFGVAAVFTSAVLVVWVVSRPEASMLRGVTGQVSETAAPFATLIKESKEQLAQLRGAVATTTTQASSTEGQVPSADALILTPEDILIANTAATATISNESTSTEPRVYVEVLIGTSSVALPPPQNNVSSSTEILI